MDVRGIEVTNQLRSAIRAKLLELGVRYDEELPDYILVMVVNKKSRQQMHDDLFLFLEESTTPFVDWLHDQVLKKLQKVTVAKKKTSRELVPSIVVKQEEERKKRKSATSFLEDQTANTSSRDDKQLVRDTVQLPPETIQNSVPEVSPETSVRNTYVPENRLDSIEDHIEPLISQEESNKEKTPSNKTETNCQSFNKIVTHSIKKVEQPKGRNKEEEKEEESSSGKLKSSVSKPKITSVVSVKNRLGIISPKKKFDSSRDSHYKASEKRPIRNSRERRNNFSGGRTSGFRNTSDSDISKRSSSDVRSRLGSTVDSRPRTSEKSTDLSIKDRLGVNSLKLQKPELENSKTLSSGRSRNVKNRLGPVRNNFRMMKRNDRLDAVEDELDEDEEVVAPMKSHIIAVNRAPNDVEDEDEDTTDCKVPSKVIVTPRPLKPLQPIQKRATQSLLLRAVAEANQSVVMQKNPEPSLTDKRPAAKRLQSSGLCQVGNNLSVHLNEKNRFVMEKLQVELTTEDVGSDATKSQRVQEVTDEQLGVVMSLFQRGDDSQKFLVTLNGYNNNVNKENSDDDEEGLEMEVNEDELILENSQSEAYLQEESNLNDSVCDLILEDNSFNDEQPKIENNNENQNIENVEYKEKKPCRKRKLSPIVYNRSPTPSELKSKSQAIMSIKYKKPVVDSSVSIINDKTKEKCRYWPNCTLGIKCTFYHPEILCSAFPACKYGEKCIYKHPKCKFGIACTKLGCIFSHPSQQCKYHPFCTKPACPYSHAPVTTALPTEITKQRAKFTWKRQE